jgi:hypothetical protein
MCQCERVAAALELLCRHPHLERWHRGKERWGCVQRGGRSGAAEEGPGGLCLGAGNHKPARPGDLKPTNYAAQGSDVDLPELPREVAWKTS